MFNKSNFCHIASNNRNEQKGSVFIYKTSDTLAQVTQSGYFNEKLIDINVHDLIIHVQYDPVARTLKKSVLIVTERTMDNVETAPILDQTIGDDIDQLGDQVAGIEEKIPGAASAANQLADKAFVTTIKNAIETTIAEINQDIDSLQETKQDKATAVNYDNITNCITEIPQDIKLELNDGVLTLKAGSKYYKPDGTYVVTTSDYNVPIAWNAAASGIIVIGNGSYACYAENRQLSGATNPTGLTGNSYLFWNTTENKMYWTTNGGSTWNAAPNCSVPIARVTWGADNKVTSINEIYNGFGYMGSTIFALPGVKGLIPNGRNEDGTLKNTGFTTGSVLTQTITNATFDARPVVLNAYILGFNAGAIYDNKTNRLSTGNYMIGGTGSAVSGLITSFEPKPAFHAVDYSDFENTAEELNSSISAVDSSAVHKTGNETIGGKKTFTDSISSNKSVSGPVIKNDNGGQLWLFDYNLDSTSKYKGGFLLRCLKPNGTYLDFVGNNSGLLTWQDNQLATMPNYSAGVAFTLNKTTPYTAPKDGVVFILTGRANDQGSSITIDGTQVASTISNWSNIPYFFPVAKGTVVSTGYDTISTAIFYPLKGAI